MYAENNEMSDNPGRAMIPILYEGANPPMKRLLSLILSAILLIQALPTTALAAPYASLPTEAEIDSLIAVSGTEDEAADYISGMKLSSGMNGEQMLGWIHDFQNETFLGIMDGYQDMDMTISAWDEGKKKEHQKAIETFNSWYRKGISLQYEINYWAETLQEHVDKVRAYSEEYEDSEVDEEYREKYTLLLAESGKKVREAIRKISGKGIKWEQQAHDLEEALIDLEMNDMAGGAVLTASAAVLSAKEVSAPDAPADHTATRLGRLLPISSALADTNATMSITVVDDKEFLIHVVADGKGVAGAAVQVTKDKKTKENKTDENGRAAFQVRDFSPDSDGEVEVSVQVTAKGYRPLTARGLYIRKGSICKVSLEKDGPLPFIAEWSYDGHDILNNEYKIITTPQNDVKKNISLKVQSNQADFSYSVWYEQNRLNNKNVPQKEKVSLVKDKKVSGKEDTVNLTGTWQKDLMGDAQIYVQVRQGDQEKTYTSKLKVERAILAKPLSFSEKNSVFNKTIEFTFPKSFPGPLSSSKISIEIPFAKWWPITLNIGLDGSGFFYMGSEPPSESKLDTDDWKNKNYKEMAKKVKDAEEQGWLKQQRLKSGNDECYKKRQLLAGVEASSSLFFYGKTRYTKGDGAKGVLSVAGGAGFGFNMRAEAKFLFYGLVFIGVYFSANAIYALQLGFDFYTSWPEGQKLPTIESYKWSPRNTGFNLMIRLEMGAFAGIGYKGVASVTVTGYGFLTFVVDMNLDKKDLQLTGGFGANVVAQFLFFKWSRQLGDEIRYRLIPGPVERISRNPGMLERLIAFIAPSAAQAEPAQESTDETKNLNMWNENLILEGKRLTELKGATGEGISYVRTVPYRNISTSDEYVFYTRENSAGLITLYSQLISDGAKGFGKEQDLRALIMKSYPESALQSRHIADYTVQRMELPNYDSDHRYPSSVLNGTVTEKALREILVVTMTLTTNFEDVTYQGIAGDGTALTASKAREPKETDYCIVIGLMPDQNGQLITAAFKPNSSTYFKRQYQMYCEMELDSGLRLIDPQTDHSIRVLGNKYDMPDMWKYMLNVTFSSITGESKGKLIGIQASYIDLDGGRAPVDRCYVLGSGTKEADNYTFHSITGVHDSKPGEGEYITNHWYAIAQKKKETRRRLMTHTRAGGLVQISEDADNVLQYVYQKGSAMGERGEDTVLYLAEDPKNNNMARLKQAMVTVNMMEYEPRAEFVRVFDMGISLPDATMHYANLHGNELMWWVESSPENGQETSKRNIWKVRGIWLSRDKKDTPYTVTTPFTMAMIVTDDKNVAPEAIGFLDREDGRGSYGYYVLSRKSGKNGYDTGSTKGTLYSFPVQRTASMDIYGVALSNAIAASGSLDEFTVSVANNGSTTLYGADFTLYGEAGGKKETIEKIHVDFRDPTRSQVKFSQPMTDGTTLLTNGSNGVRLTDSVLWNGLNKTFLIKGVQWSPGSKQKKAISRQIQMQGLLPSTSISMAIQMMVPRGWSTGRYKLILKADKLYVQGKEKIMEIPLLDTGAKISGSTETENTLTGGAATEKADEEMLAVALEDSGNQVSLYTLDKKGEPDKDVSRDADYRYLFLLDQDAFDTYEFIPDETDLEIEYDRWDDGSTEMVTLYIFERGYREPTRKVYLKAYLDEEESPCFYYPLGGGSDGLAVTDGKTWNIDMPVAALTGGRHAQKVKVTVGDDRAEEAGTYDNEITLLFDLDPFCIVEEPQDLTLKEGESGSFRVTVSGGRTPYQYQWQKRQGDGDWTDLEDWGPATELKNVKTEQSGSEYRCVINDANGLVLITRTAVLKVDKEIPKTGDRTPVAELMIPIGIAMIGLAVLLMTEKRKRRETK